MPKMRAFMYFALFGAACFWLPDTLMHAIFKDLSVFQMVVMTGVSITSVSMGVLYLQRSHWEDRFLVPVASLSGIWLTAGFAMGVNGLFTGAGFAVPNGWTLIFTGMVPPIAFLMSSYDGSYFALSIATIGLLTLWIWRLFHI